MAIKGPIKVKELIQRLTYYRVLGVHRGSTQAEIEEAWKKLSRETHPDVHHAKQSEEDRERQTIAFKRVSEAYNVLKDRKLRALYDRLLEITGDPCPQCKGAGRIMQLRNRPSMRDMAAGVTAPEASALACDRCQGSGRLKRAGTQAPELMQTGGK